MLLDLFDFPRVLKLIITKLFLEKMFEWQTIFYILLRSKCGQFRFSFSFFSFFEVHIF